MSTLALNALVTKALLDDVFQKDILNGKRLELIKQFELSIDEKKAVLSIKADSVEQFIYKVNQWMSAFEISQRASNTNTDNTPDAENILSHSQAHLEPDNFST